MTGQRIYATAVLGAFCISALARPAVAEEATVAVASNFLVALETLQLEFENATGHDIRVVSGSTGQLYSQIVNGAPFDIMLAADQARPLQLAALGLGDQSTIFTYAVGRLALWSSQPDRVQEGTLNNLLEQSFRWIAIAEPEIAPYGTAARQVLRNLGVWESIGPRVVKGQNIAQTFALAATGNAELGLVAVSQIIAPEGPSSYQVVPAELHDPIRQDVILLYRAADNAAARAFLDFLRSDQAKRIIERNGYSVQSGPD